MLTAFVIYLLGVAGLGWAAHRFMSGRHFVKECFLGNRQLGAWVLAISFAATAISGGSFMGFPALIYKNGWVMALLFSLSASWLVTITVSLVTRQPTPETLRRYFFFDN